MDKELEKAYVKVTESRVPINESHVTLPKHVERYVTWQNNQSHAYYLVGYCPDTLAYFQALFEDAKKTFPDLDAKDCTCSKVRRSSSKDGFTYFGFPINGPKREIKGFGERDIDFGY